MAARKNKKKSVEEAPPEVELEVGNDSDPEEEGVYKMLAAEDAKAYVEAKRPKLAVSPPPAVPGRKYSFNQWAASKGKKPHHLAGLRAFCKTVKRNRTFEDWDKVFKDY